MASRASSFRILVVEDHPDVGQMMKLVLEMLGHRASVARTLRESQEHLTREAFDLVIVDYRLPDGTGIDLLKRLPFRESLRAILVTAQEQGLMDPADQNGFSACLTKPVDMDELRRVIDTVCGGKDA